MTKKKKGQNSYKNPAIKKKERERRQYHHTKRSLALFLEVSIALSLGLADGTVGGNAGNELITAVGLLDVLNPHVDPLPQVLSSHSLQHLHSDGSGGHIPHLAGLSVVDSVGHTTVHGGVGLDVNNVSEVVVHQVGGEVGVTMLAETLGKLVPGLSSETVCARHLSITKRKKKIKTKNHDSEKGKKNKVVWLIYD